MKKTISTLLIVTSLALFTACKSDPSPTQFDLTDDERQQLENEIKDLNETISQADPSANGDNYFTLGGLYMRLSDYEGALEAYEKAVEYQPNSGVIHSNLSTIHEELGDFDKALEEIDLALAIGPDYAPFYLKKGKLLRYKFEISPFDMDDFYREAITSTGDDSGVLLMAADHYEYEGKQTGEVRAYYQALVFYRMILSKKADDKFVLDKVAEIEDKVDELEMEEVSAEDVEDAVIELNESGEEEIIIELDEEEEQ